MIDLTLALLTLAAMWALLDWRQGLALSVLVGLAQDPLRKLSPNQPVYFVVLVGVVFGAAFIRATLSRVRLGPGALPDWRQRFRLPFTLFIVLILAQATTSFVRFGSFRMTGIGLLVWLAPIPAVLLAYQFALRRGLAGVKRLLLFYCFFAMMSLAGVYLEYAGFDWPALGEVGEGLIIYDVGIVLKAYSGFFRSSEIAAWHTAAIACFAFILTVGKRATPVRLMAAAVLILALIGLGILTGRRKMLIEVTVFLGIYGFLISWLKNGAFRLGVYVLAIALIGYVGFASFLDPDIVQRSSTANVRLADGERFEGYTLRGSTAFADLPRRISEQGLQPMLWAIDRYGWFGIGLGTGSQGTQAIAEASQISQGPAEGGLGKITMELGVPGIFLLVWLFVALFRHTRKQIILTVKLSLPHTRAACGLAAFLVANAGTFSVATQAYSDLFILLLLGWTLGFLMAMPVLAARGDGRRMPRRLNPVAGGQLMNARVGVARNQ